MASKTIILKGTGIRNETDAGAAITPGMLLTFDSNGDVIPHNITGGRAAADFAVQEDFLGKTIDEAYASGDRVQHVACHAGMQVNALVKAGVAAITKGDFLVSDDAGTLINIVDVLALSPVPLEHAVIARALEDVDNSGGSANVRIIVEVV